MDWPPGGSVWANKEDEKIKARQRGIVFNIKIGLLRK
jgi:hypothetical protein